MPEVSTSGSSQQLVADIREWRSTAKELSRVHYFVSRALGSKWPTPPDKYHRCPPWPKGAIEQIKLPHFFVKEVPNWQALVSPDYSWSISGGGLVGGLRTWVG